MDKKITAQEAAKAVLKKAEEMLKSSKLAKSKVRSDMDHGSKKGPEGYSKYQEQAQNQKGVHTPVSGVTGFPGGKGTSAAGDMSTQTYAGKPHKELRDHGKDMHRAKLAEIKAMPKPNLTKEEELAKANRSEEEFGANKAQKEVRRKIMNPGHPNRDNEIKDGGRENVNHPTDKKGVSHVGEAVRRGATKYAKSMVQEKINTSKFQTKIGQNPDLTKANIPEKDQTPADGVQKETIGQHDPAQGKENMNAPWGTEPGCHKLSKFMGRKEEKAKAKSTQEQAAPVEKTENVQVENKGIGKEIESAKPTPKPPAPKNPKHPQKAD